MIIYSILGTGMILKWTEPNGQSGVSAVFFCGRSCYVHCVFVLGILHCDRNVAIVRLTCTSPIYFFFNIYLGVIELQLPDSATYMQQNHTKHFNE